ncbi:MAG TPA: hypothetical protein VGC30_14390 [Dokdonella sp.]
MFARMCKEQDRERASPCRSPQANGTAGRESLRTRRGACRVGSDSAGTASAAIVAVAGGHSDGAMGSEPADRGGLGKQRRVRRPAVLSVPRRARIAATATRHRGREHPLGGAGVRSSRTSRRASIGLPSIGAAALTERRGYGGVVAHPPPSENASRRASQRPLYECRQVRTARTKAAVRRVTKGPARGGFEAITRRSNGPMRTADSFARREAIVEPSSPTARAQRRADENAHRYTPAFRPKQSSHWT